jgi:hypothetical protein
MVRLVTDRLRKGDLLSLGGTASAPPARAGMTFASEAYVIYSWIEW